MPQCYRDSGTIHTHAHTRQQTGNHPDVGYVAFILKALFADSGKQVDGVLTWILTILRFDPLPQIFFFFFKKGPGLTKGLFLPLCGFSSKALAKLNSTESDVVSTSQESHLDMSNFWEYPHSFERMKEQFLFLKGGGDIHMFPLYFTLTTRGRVIMSSS